MAWLWWLATALVLGVVELLTVDLVFLMFAGGAAAAALAALFGAPVFGQVFAFAGVSLLLLFVVRPSAKRFIERSTPQTRTNAAAQVGRPATVLIDVTEHAGRVKLAGEVWTARASIPGAIHPAGTTVRVVRIDGAVAVVEATADEALPG